LHLTKTAKSEGESVMGIPKLTPEQWANIRIEREAGASFGFLSAKYGVSKTVIARRAEREGWSDGSDAAETVRRKAQEKLYELPDAAQKRAAAIEAAADRAAEILRRHQEETNAVRERLYAGLKAHREAKTRAQKLLAFEDLKAAKIASETLINLQKIERINWGLDSYGGAKTEIVIERSYGVYGAAN